MSTLEKKPSAPLPARRRERVKAVRRGMKMRPVGSGRVWKSFEQFRSGGQAELAALESGEIGQLLTKTGSFRILREEDFQRLHGLARDVERIQGGLRVIIAAARSARRHQDEDTIQTLLEAVAACATFPTLPTRVADELPKPEGIDLDDDDLDGIMIDPESVPRPYQSRYEGE